MASETGKPVLRFMKRDRTQYLAESSKDGLSHLKMILVLQPQERSTSQVQTLVTYTKHIKFFSELADKEGASAHEQCVKYMYYQSVKAGQVIVIQFIFHAGDEGSRFYIILSGSVAVLAPQSHRGGKQDYTLLTMLRSGDSFGELALISHKPRAASILTREQTTLAVLERNDYLRLLSNVQDARLAHRVELLQRHPAFAAWSKGVLQKLSYFFKQHTYQRKQVLFRAGQPASAVFLIQSGDFQLSKTIYVDLHRRTLHLRETESTQYAAEVTLISTGEMIGDQETIAGGTYEYTCLCYSAQGEVLQITKEDFMKHVVNDQSVKCLLGLNRVKEAYRSSRLELISKLEAEKWARGLPSPLSKDSPQNADLVSGSLARASTSLKNAVRSRWHLPSSHLRSLAIDKELCQQWLRSPVPSPPTSPSPDHRTEGSTSPVSPKHKPRKMSWVDLVQLKYFHKRADSSQCCGLKSSHSPTSPEPVKALHGYSSFSSTPLVRSYV